MNWKDPRDRAALAARVGPVEYGHLQEAEFQRSVVCVENGYAIRQIDFSVWPPAFRVVGAGAWFSTADQAKRYAAQIDPGPERVAIEERREPA